MKDESSLARNSAAFADFVGFAEASQRHLRLDASGHAPQVIFG